MLVHAVDQLARIGGKRTVGVALVLGDDVVHRMPGDVLLVQEHHSGTTRLTARRIRVLGLRIGAHAYASPSVENVWPSSSMYVVE